MEKRKCKECGKPLDVAAKYSYCSSLCAVMTNYTYYENGVKKLTKTPEQLIEAVQRYDNNRAKTAARNAESKRNARSNDPKDKGGQAI